MGRITKAPLLLLEELNVLELGALGWDEATRNRSGSVCLWRQLPCSIALLKVPISLKLDADACRREPIRMRRVHLLSSVSTVHYPLLVSSSYLGASSQVSSLILRV
jgi:hypothetical protein